MVRGSVLLGLLACAIGAVAPARAQPAEPDLQQALAFQKVMQKVIAEVEPSIACILVSRSDAYQRLGLQPAKDSPGRLGSFNSSTLDVPGLTREDRFQLQPKLDLADPRYVPQAFGSGIVVDAGGLILTNFHVVQDATKIHIRLPGGKSSYADIHAADPRADLAVLRVLNTAILPLTPMRLGDGDRVERGQFVLSIANPFAVGFRDGQPSASWGIISNVRRRIVSTPREGDRTKPLHHYGTLLQTDARLHLGCSGGALVDLHGGLIGITSSLAAIEGGETPGGFAFPVNAGTRRILEVLKRGEEVDYGLLGVSFDNAGGERHGAILKEVAEGSPAYLDGGLRMGDIIVSVNDVPIRDSDDLFVQLGTQLAGAKVRFQVRRGGRAPQSVDITLAKLYVPGKRIVSSPGNRPIVRGLRVDYTSLLAQQPQRQLGPIPAGVLVSEVQPDSAGERAHLKVGDVITHVNQRPVPIPAAFYRALADVRGPIELTLHNFAGDASAKVQLK